VNESTVLWLYPCRGSRICAWLFTYRDLNHDEAQALADQAQLVLLQSVIILLNTDKGRQTSDEAVIHPSLIQADTAGGAGQGTIVMTAYRTVSRSDDNRNDTA
jgi:hypothetical protein